MIRQICVALFLGALALAATATATERPNIVFIVADDLGVNDLECYGRDEHETPHLDALAAAGMRFTSAYCAQPICSASRAAIMTGNAPARLHLTTFLPGRADTPSQLLLHPKIEQQLSLAEVTIAETLKAAGYHTACIGKWHLGGKGFSPLEQGFDVYHEGHAKTEPTADEGGKGEFDLAQHAVEFIDAHRAEPFFLYLAHNNPHIPLSAQRARIDRFSRTFNPTYAAMLETLDESVGRVLERLDQLKLTEKTLVVFTSDNGGLHVPEGDLTPATHNTPFRAGKGFLYDGGLRIPLIVRWPGIVTPKTVTDTPVINSDWAATFAEIVGTPTAGQDGESLVPILKGSDSARPEREFFWHFPHYTNQGGRPGGAIRSGEWKLIEHYEDGRLELFKLPADPFESVDLADLYPERVAELRGKLEAWRRIVGAQENTANPEFDLARWKKVYGGKDASRLAKIEADLDTAPAWSAWRRQMNDAIKAKPGLGAVILHARDAQTHGEKLLYEQPPHKDTLGYWVNSADWAEWSFIAPSEGEYSVQILQGCGTGSGGAEVEIRFDDQPLRFVVQETGHFQRFIPRDIGTVKLTGNGPHTLTVRAISKPNVAVMDLRRVTLRAIPLASGR